MTAKKKDRLISAGACLVLGALLLAGGVKLNEGSRAIARDVASRRVAPGAPQAGFWLGVGQVLGFGLGALFVGTGVWTLATMNTREPAREY